MIVERWILTDGTSYITGVSEYGVARWSLTLCNALSWPTKQAAVNYRSRYHIKQYHPVKIEYPNRRPYAEIPPGAHFLGHISTYLLRPTLVAHGVDRRASAGS